MPGNQKPKNDKPKGATAEVDLGNGKPGKEDEGKELAIVKSAAEVRAELEGAIILAKQFPRNDYVVLGRIESAFSRPMLAGKAQYHYPRGGAEIRGESVHTARAIGQAFGNIRWGLDIVRDDEDFRTIEGWAWELESNVKIEAQDHFQKLIFRKVGGWIKPDERDLSELTNRRGAKLVRNCLLQVVPSDLVDKAIEIATKALAGELKNRQDAIRKMVSIFDKIGVSVAMLVNYLGHELDTINEEEFVKLRGIYQSIVDGNSKREEHFEMTPPKEGKAEKEKDAVTEEETQPPKRGRRPSKEKPPEQGGLGV